MKLIYARVQNFRSVEDSGKFAIDELTCLVGKNEAGKSAILDAIYGQNPYGKFAYEKTRDYPRRFLTKFQERHPNGESEVVRTWWELSNDDIDAVNAVLGDGVLQSPIIEVASGIGFSQHWVLDVNERLCIEQAIDEMRPNAAERAQIAGTGTTRDFLDKVKSITDPSAKIVELRDRFKKFRDGRATLQAIDILSKRMPKFFLTSHFNRMSGEISLDALANARANDKVSKGDQIFLDFVEYAGTSIEELRKTKKHEDLVAKCEAASNDITDEMLNFWSQNDALSIQIELGEGKPDDPAPFNSGPIVKIRIWNANHRASLPLSERSAGFVWFFSFLSQFKQLSKNTGNVILLLDEPGLTLHGKAQADLLRYIKERLLVNHQVIYTTHSPFLVPANQLASVRVVEDVVSYPKERRGKPSILGTKVTAEVLSVDSDTLFPLRSHLGYELTQSLFIGQNTLLVEGPSDILFLQAASDALRRCGGTALDPRWTLCPCGGIDKIHSFASLFRGNGLNIAVLTDFGDGDKKKIERLRQSEILHKSQIFTAAEFTGASESDVEDLFDPHFYTQLLNLAFSIPPNRSVDPTVLAEAAATPRIVKQAEAYFRITPALLDFDHFTPAAYLIRHPELLDDRVDAVGRFEPVFKAFNDLLPKP